MDDRTIIGSLHRAVAMSPEKEIIKLAAGGSYSAAYTIDRAARFAGLASRLGVATGDRVVLMISNRYEFVEAFFGAAYLGAVSVPLNTNMRGPILEHMVSNVSPAAVVVESDFLEVMTTALRHAGSKAKILVVDPQPGGEGASGEMVDYGLAMDAESPVAPAPVTRYDNAVIMYTSGTTGPSKGVLHTHNSIVAFGDKAQWLFRYTADDVSHNCLPLFHANALCVTLLPSVRIGATAFFGRRFSASGFWPELREHKATVTSILGAMVPILWGAEPSARDLDNEVRVALSVPTPPAEFYDGFERRFGLRLVSQYGMSDTSMVIGTPPDVRGRPGYAGVSSGDFECVVVDEHDQPVPDGTPGELVVRPLKPDIMMRGYWNNPSATLDAFRNLWFHTGDVLIREPDGWFKFIDRKKDAIRRFGENISSFEVESVIAMHPDVAEIAVYGVPAQLSEDEVMAAVVFRPGHEPDMASLGRYCDEQLPYFASPRYLVAMDELPKTENEKVRKDVLRGRGVTPETVDRGPRGRSAQRAGSARGLAASAAQTP